MSAEERAQRRAASAHEFNLHEHRGDGVRIANSLGEGLLTLRDLCFTRVHGDVELTFGNDSMLLPVAVLKGEAETNKEIEVYQISEAAIDARDAGYVKDADNWLLPWLSRLRLGDSSSSPTIAERMSHYIGRGPDERRLTFSTRLQHLLPEVVHAPLVMFRLFPLAISIVVSIAFGDSARAGQTRQRQMNWLPSIADCHACHGRLLDNGEKCPQCGNPFWKYDWLTAE
jgi:hypothetical protein